MTKKTIVKPRKWNETLWDESEIKAKLDSALESAGFSKEDIILKPAKYLSGSLINQLQLYNFSITGKRSAEPAIRRFGWKTQKHTTEQEIENMFLKKINFSYLEKILLNGKSNHHSFKKLFMFNSDGSEDKEGLKVYGAIVGKNKNSKVDYFKIYCDKLFKNTEQELGESVYNIIKGNFMKGDNLVNKVTQYFYELKKDVSLKSLKVDKESNIIGQRIRRYKKSDELNFNTYTQKLCALLKFDKKYSPLLALDRNGALREGASIMELLNYFSLSILKRFDPKLERIDSYFKKFYSGTIEQIFHSTPKSSILVENGAESDGRVITTIEDILIECKNHKIITKAENNISDEIIRQYNGHEYWKSGHKITKRIAILNTDAGDVEHQKKALENNYWQVMMGQEFQDFVLNCTDLLLKEDPDFFSNAPVPIYSGDEFMQSISETLFKQSHLLLNKGNKKYRQWLINFFRENSKAVSSDERFSHEKFSQIHTKPVQFFEAPLNSPIEYDLGNFLFFDLETAGTLNTDSPLFTIGSLYKNNGFYNVDIFLVRNPWEEIKGLEYFNKKIEALKKEHNNITLISFNGNVFDKPYLVERQIVNRVKPVDYEHLDIMPSFRKIQTTNKEKYTLQTYEFKKWGVHRRDISGKRIAEIWENYVNGKDDSLIPNVIHHNSLDVITTAHLFSELYKDEFNLKRK